MVRVSPMCEYEVDEVWGDGTDERKSDKKKCWKMFISLEFITHCFEHPSHGAIAACDANFEIFDIFEHCQAYVRIQSAGGPDIRARTTDKGEKR